MTASSIKYTSLSNYGRKKLKITRQKEISPAFEHVRFRPAIFTIHYPRKEVDLIAYTLGAAAFSLRN